MCIDYKEFHVHHTFCTDCNIELIFQNDLNEPYIPRIGLDGERIRIKKEKDPDKKKKKRKKEGLDSLDPLKPKKVKVITVGLDGEKLKKKKLKLMKPKIKRELDENGMGRFGKSFDLQMK